MNDITEKVLFNVLKSIRNKNGDEYKAAPDADYLKSLESIGFIKMGWDNELTELGTKTLNNLESEQWK